MPKPKPSARQLEIRKVLGDRVKRLRAQHKTGPKTQSWLARRLGEDRSTVIRLEAETRVWDLELAENVALAFDLPPFEFLAPVFGAEASAEVLASAIGAAEIELLSRLQGQVDLAVARANRSDFAELYGLVAGVLAQLSDEERRYELRHWRYRRDGQFLEQTQSPSIQSPPPLATR